MHDDRSNRPAGPTPPEAENRQAAEPRPGTAGDTSDVVGGADAERPPRHPDPTRYGDWEKGGRCIDF